MRGGFQVHSLAAYAAEDFAAHGHSVSDDNTFDLALFTDDNLGAAHVAFKLAVDLLRLTIFTCWLANLRSSLITTTPH